MKKLLWLGIWLLFSLYTWAQQPNFQGFKYVKDEANLLTKTAREQLEIRLQQYEKESSNEIVVATINSLGGQNINDFAGELAQKMKIGKAGKNNGVLILIAPSERKMRIEVGYGLEPSISDGATQQIIQDILRPNFQKQKFYEGIDAAVSKIIELAQGEFKPEATDNQVNTQGKSDNANDNSWLIGGGVVAGLAGTGIYLSRQAARRRRRRLVKALYDNLADKINLTDWDLVKQYYQAETVDAQNAEWQNKLISIGSDLNNYPQLENLAQELIVLDKIKRDEITSLSNQGLLKLRPTFELQKVGKIILNNQAYYQDPVFNQNQVSEAFVRLNQELQYFADKKDLNLHLEDQKRLQEAIQYFNLLAEKPAQVLDYDYAIMQASAQGFIGAIDWDRLAQHYTESSIDATQKTFVQKSQSIDNEAYKANLEELYFTLIPAFKADVTRFLDPIPQQVYTTHSTGGGTTYGGGTTIITSSYNDYSDYSDKSYSDSTYSDSSSYSDSYSDSSSYSDSYSDSSFGGGDFGGGGSSGDW
jgi:uncharacterized membrane protein YgcG